MSDASALAPSTDIDPAAAIPPLGLGNLADPGTQRLILVATTSIPERLAIEGQELAHPSLTEPKALGAPLSRRSLRLANGLIFGG